MKPTSVVYRAVILAGACALAWGVAHAEPVVSLAVLDRDVRIVFDRTAEVAQAASGSWSDEIEYEDATFLLVHLELEAFGQGQWIIEFLDGSDQVLQKVARQDFTDGPPFVLWTVEVPGARAGIRVAGDAAGLRFRVDRLLRGRSDLNVPSSIVGEHNDLQSICDFEGGEIFRWGQHVANLKILSTDDAYYPCTGFLLTESLLITNRHCVNDTTHRVVAELDYVDCPEDGAGVAAVLARPTDAFSENADFAILRLAGSSGRGDPPPMLAVVDLDPQTPAIVVQHPGNEPKQVAREDCEVARNNPVEYVFMHTCDTVGGSSGSPVFGVDGKVIGMHATGFAETGLGKRNTAIKTAGILKELGLGDPEICAEIPGCLPQASGAAEPPD